MIETEALNKAMSREQWQQTVSQLVAQHKTVVLLDSPDALSCQWSLVGWGCRQRVSLVGNTLYWRDYTLQNSERLQATIEQSDTVWAVLEQARQQSRIYWPDQPQLPFHGGLMGLLHYEAAGLCDDALKSVVEETIDTNTPRLEFVECDGWALWDHETGQVVVSSNQALFQQEAPTLLKELLGLPVLRQPWQASLSQPQFEAQAERLLHAIQQGECYQANLSIQWKNQLKGDLWPVYQALTAKNPSPFAGFWQTGAQTVVCNSPERLVQVENRWPEGEALPQQWVTTRPIAGTRGRGATPADDEAIGESLRGDAKEQAEHLMLVDLLRNDIGKITAIGTVNVRELMVLERYAHVTHLVSDVEGQLLPNTTPWQVLQALFPGGTITGCPKIRSVQWLHQCEPVLRGPYTGSMGYVDVLTGAMDWNIIIRSVYATRAKEQPSQGVFPVWDVAFHAGAGIVADSIPANEYRECLRKAQSIFSVWQ